MFLEMGYIVLTPNFHTFHGERSPVGLAFADVKEASNFQNCFGNLLSRWNRKLDTGTQNNNMTGTNPPQAPKPTATESPIVCRLLSEEDKRLLRACLDGRSVVVCAAVVCVHVPASTDSWRQLHSGVATIEEDSSRQSYFIRLYDLNQKKSITISAPTNFRHVQHMGFNKDSKQFDMSVLDEKMLQEFLKDNNLHCLFNSAEDTEFAAQFIARNIGIKKFNHAMKSRAPPPPVVVPAATPTVPPARSAMPSVPSFPHRPTVRPPPIPTTFTRPHAPPPPPPVPAKAPPPLRPPPQARGEPPPPRGPSSTGGVAPPPPPPPPPAPAPAPAPSDRTDGAGSQPPSIPMDLQSAIHSFNRNTLKRVSGNHEPAVAEVVTGDDHKDLLAATLSEALNNLMSSRRAYLSDEDSSEDSDF